MSSSMIVFVLFLVYIGTCYSFVPSFRCLTAVRSLTAGGRRKYLQIASSDNVIDNDQLTLDDIDDMNPSLDRSDFSSFLNRMDPEGLQPEKLDEVGVFTDAFSNRSEEIFRAYPYKNQGLPILSKCDNFYSGKMDKYIWHQNFDEVYIFLPISDDINTNTDIEVDIQVFSIGVKVGNEISFQLNLPDRVIPDGSFWTVERDKDDQRYLHIDLEKRFRAINWRSLFVPRNRPEGNSDIFGSDSSSADPDRNDLLQKLYEANKGISKISGLPPPSLEDMKNDPDLMKSITSRIDTRPRTPDSDINNPVYVDADPLSFNQIVEMSADMKKHIEENGESSNEIVDV